VLLDFAGAIPNFIDSMDTYFNEIGKHEVLNPFQNSIHSNSTKINEPVSCEFFERFGIRRLVLNAFPGRLSISNYYHIERDPKNIASSHWNNIKNDVIIEEFKTLFKSCDIIQFADWASAYNASDFWDGLLSDVIRPLNKKNFQFIFYLGDPTKRVVFETDEILDIISEYSSYGKVTLVLNENEADRLWAILHGWYAGSTHFGYKSKKPTEKYSSIFNTMSVDALVVFCVNSTVLFLKEQRLEFAGRSLNNINSSKHAKGYFDAGYQLGLLLQLKIPDCIDLGLTISEACLDNEIKSEQKSLFKYIKECIDELKAKPYTQKNELQNPSEKEMENRRIVKVALNA
jgi:hypothetical protein